MVEELRRYFFNGFISVDEILVGRRDGDVSGFYFVVVRKESLGKEEVIYVWKIRG